MQTRLKYNTTYIGRIPQSNGRTDDSDCTLLYSDLVLCQYHPGIVWHLDWDQIFYHTTILRVMQLQMQSKKITAANYVPFQGGYVAKLIVFGGWELVALKCCFTTLLYTTNHCGPNMASISDLFDGTQTVFK